MSTVARINGATESGAPTTRIAVTAVLMLTVNLALIELGVPLIDRLVPIVAFVVLCIAGIGGFFENRRRRSAGDPGSRRPFNDAVRSTTTAL